MLKGEELSYQTRIRIQFVNARRGWTCPHRRDSIQIAASASGLSLTFEPDLTARSATADGLRLSVAVSLGTGAESFTA
jgi:hypothetical protein